MKYTLLQMVQKILNDMDSEEVNSLSDSAEALQVASIVEDVFYTLIAARTIPEHKELLKLEALSDSDFPTHFKYGENVKEVEEVWYDKSTVDGETEWTKITYLEPTDFLSKTDNQNGDYVLVSDKNGGTSLNISTDQSPMYYTSFDDEYIVMNSIDLTVENTLQASKSRAFGTVYPTFSISDSFVPDLDETLFPYFLAEAKSTALVTLKGESNPKIEQQARRLKAYTQNDKYKTKKRYVPDGYGR